MVSVIEVLSFFGSIREKITSWVYLLLNATVGKISGAKITPSLASNFSILIIGILFFIFLKIATDTQKRVINPLLKFALWVFFIVLVLSMFIPF